MSSRPPSPAEQVRFLRQIQRLLDEGSFVATYKYALLHAIADLCIALGDDSGAELTLPTHDIAERFVELYWRQAVPFPAGPGPALLAQNTGRQAAVVRVVAEARAEYGGSLARVRTRQAAWADVVRDVESTVRQMPLWRLQTVGSQTVDFLYANMGRGTSITLKPGVAFCFRAFYSMIVEMVEGAWSHYIRRHNQALLGTNVELRSFLFGSDRAALTRFRPILEDLQDGRCFYCRGQLPRECHVDHFIPWRRYPVDLGHNFVLAHRRCNSQKADRLAAPVHLERWHRRNHVHGEELGSRFRDQDIRFDLSTSYQVARWAYQQVERAGGSAWVEGAVLAPVKREWRRILEDA
jgi:HNH endonuclease